MTLGRNFLLALFFTLFQFKTLYSQSEFSKVETDYYTSFINYYQSDGICSYEFTDIIQDGMGLMWFATQDGLMRFDGNNFKTYRGGKTKGQLLHSVVSSLAVDKKKNLWVGTKGGLCVYHPESDTFERVDSLFGKPLQGHRWVRDIYVDSKGRLWVDRHYGTLNCVDFDAKTVETFQHEYDYSDIYYFHAITEFGDGVMLGGGSAHLTWLTRNPDKWNTYPNVTTIINNEKITIAGTANFYDDGSDYIWVANYADNAYRINKKTMERTPLPLPSVYSICPNGDGKVWMGGYHFGAVLYNPSTNTATRYIRLEGNPQSLAGNMILVIYRDNQGNTWFGTNNGLSLLTTFARKSTHLRKIADVNSLPSNQITCMLPEYPKGLWLGTQNKGLVFINFNTKNVTRFGYFNHSDSLASNWVTSIARTTDNSMLVTLWNGYGGALNRFWPDKKRFKRYNPDGYYWYSNVITTSDGKALFSPWGLGVYEFDPRTDWVTSRMYFISEHLCANASGEINKISAFNNGWILFDDETILNVLNHDTLTLVPFKLSNVDIGIPKQKQVTFNIQAKKMLLFNSNLIILGNDNKIYSFSLPTRKIEPPLPSDFSFTNIFADKYLYALTDSALLRWNQERGKFDQLTSTKQYPGIKSIADGNDTIFLGTSEGVYVMTEHTKTLTKLFDADVQALTFYKGFAFGASNKGLLKFNGKGLVKRYLSEQSITNFTIDSSGNVWATNSEELFRISLKTNTIETIGAYPQSKDSLPSVQVKSIATDALGNVWILSDVCISKYLPKQKRYQSYYVPGKSALQSTLVYKMYEDSKGYVWVGYTRNGVGVDRIDRRTHTVDHFPYLPYDSTSYPATSMTHCIFEDANGNMLFGTDAGLAILQPESKAFQMIDTRHGLPSSVVTAIYQDRLGNYWIGTDKGIARFSKKLKRVDITGKNLNFSEGLVTAIEQWGFDSLVVSGNFGLYIFNPYVQGNEVPMQDIKILSCETDYDTLARFPANNSKIFVKANHKWLKIHFTASDYTSPGALEYTYWLQGFEDSTRAKKTHSPLAEYTNLPYGKYTFKVYYTRPDGTKSKNVFAINVVVGMPLYLKPWFFLIFLLLLALSVYIHEILRVQRVKRKKDELEQAVMEKTKAILAQNEELKAQADLIKQQSNNLKLKTYQINESLEFSKLLQYNLMPSPEILSTILGEHLLCYKPKDVVSGDFYWLKGNSDEFIIAVADCTGHGVHGGFVSMMDITLLNEVYTHYKISNPVELIIETHNHFNQTIGAQLQLNASSAPVEMDIAVCYVNRINKTALFASTHNPLYHIQRNFESPELKIYKSGGKALGNRWFTPNIPLVELKLESGDILVLTTDGLFDQLSKSEKKRFGRKQFESILLENANGNLDTINKKIEQYFDDWRGDSLQTDDITIIGFRI